MSQNNAASGSGTTVFIVVTVSEPVICCDSAVRGTVTIYEGIKNDSSTWVEQKNKIVTIELEGSTGGLVSGEGHAFLDFIPQGPEDCGKFIYFLGHGPPNYSAAVRSVGVGIIKLAASSKLWWFSGATPKNYPTEITLSRSPSDFLTSKWKIIAGANLVELVSPVSGATGTSMTTGVPFIKIRSKAASIQKDDVTIEHETADKKCTFKLTVFSPKCTLTLKSETETKYLFPSNPVAIGYWRSFTFFVKDQFDSDLDAELEGNEQYSDWHSVTAGEDWPPGEETGFMIKTEGGKVFVFSDVQQVENDVGHGKALNPLPVARNANEAHVEVDNYIITWRAGTKKIGEGVEMLRLRVHRYRGTVDMGNP